MGETLTEKALAFRSRPSLSSFTAAVAAVIAQGRLLETLYSLLLLLRARPGVERRDPAVQAAHARCREILLLGETGTERVRRRTHPLIDRLIPGVRVRAHAIARAGDLTIAGEYGEGATLLFVLDADRGRQECEFYRRMVGVRHIHLVHAIDHDRILVSTGDSTRRLDLWTVRSGTPVFTRCLMRVLGGHTAAVTIADETYLGTDFSNRPNFLLRLVDRRKFFLPASAYLQYVYYMEAWADRYIIVASRALDIMGQPDVISIFDTRRCSFVVCPTLA